MYRIASLFLLQKLKGSMTGDARDFNNIQTRSVIKFFFPPCKARQGTEGNSRHSDRNIRGTCTIVCHRQELGGPRRSLCVTAVASYWPESYLCLTVILFLARSQNCEKQNISCSCPSIFTRWTSLLRLDEFSVNFTIWPFFPKSVEKIQVSLKLDNNNRYFTWRPIYSFDHISLSSS